MDLPLVKSYVYHLVTAVAIAGTSLWGLNYFILRNIPSYLIRISISIIAGGLLGAGYFLFKFYNAQYGIYVIGTITFLCLTITVTWKDTSERPKGGK